MSSSFSTPTHASVAPVQAPGIAAQPSVPVKSAAQSKLDLMKSWSVTTSDTVSNIATVSIEPVAGPASVPARPPAPPTTAAARARPGRPQQPVAASKARGPVVMPTAMDEVRPVLRPAKPFTPAAPAVPTLAPAPVPQYMIQPRPRAPFVAPPQPFMPTEMPSAPFTPFQPQQVAGFTAPPGFGVMPQAEESSYMKPALGSRLARGMGSEMLSSSAPPFEPGKTRLAMPYHAPMVEQAAPMYMQAAPVEAPMYMQPAPMEPMAPPAWTQPFGMPGHPVSTPAVFSPFASPPKDDWSIPQSLPLNTDTASHDDDGLLLDLHKLAFEFNDIGGDGNAGVPSTDSLLSGSFSTFDSTPGFSLFPGASLFGGSDSLPPLDSESPMLLPGLSSSGLLFPTHNTAADQQRSKWG